MGKHRKATIVSRTVNTVRTSTNAVKAGVMKLKFWGKAPAVEATSVGIQLDAIETDLIDIEAKLASVPTSQWIPATMHVNADGSAEFTATGIDGNPVTVHAEPVQRSAGERLAASIVHETLAETIAANTDRMVKRLQEAAAEVKPITVTWPRFTVEQFASTTMTAAEEAAKPVTAEDIAEVMASVVPVKAAKPGLVKRAAKAVSKPFRRTTKVVSTETVDTNVVEIADHLKGLTEFRALCSDGGETPCGWVTVYAVDRKAARRFVTDHARGIASALFVLGGNPEITLHTGPFGIEAWEHRYPLGRRDFYIVRAVQAA